MKIGEFSDSFLPIVDGVGRVVYMVSDQLALMNHEVSVVVPMTDMGYRGRFPFEVIDYCSQKLPGSQYQAGTPMTDVHFNRMMEMKEFDIVHVHSPFMAGIAGIDYGKKHSIPMVGTFHSRYYDDFVQISHSKIVAGIGTDLMIRRFYENCDEVWTPNLSSAKTLESYGYSGAITVMPNGMELRNISSDQKDLAIRTFHLRTDLPVLLYVGQINWKKNLGTILEACAHLKASGTAFQLVLAGQGPHEREIRRKCDELSLSEDTVLTGHISETALLDGLYSAASVFVFPSLYDTAGLVVSEAANAGVPSVTVRGSNAAEVIRENENGLLCEDSASDLFRVLKENLAAPDHLKELGARAKKTIPVSWELVAKQMEERYAALIAYRKSESLTFISPAGSL